MNQFTIDILLEFLYEKYAITFVFCFFGSFVKEYLTSRKTDSNCKRGSKFNLGKVVISSIFNIRTLKKLKPIAVLKAKE